MVLTEALDYLRNVVVMFSLIPGVNQDVIYVNKHREILLEHLIHKSLEFGGDVKKVYRASPTHRGQ